MHGRIVYSIKVSAPETYCRVIPWLLCLQGKAQLNSNTNQSKYHQGAKMHQDAAKMGKVMPRGPSWWPEADRLEYVQPTTTTTTN